MVVRRVRILKYLGGKARIAKWVQGYFPPHKLYCEPFGGGAGVLLNKPRSKVEVYNDIDGEVVNFFRVLQDPGKLAGLFRRPRLTPYARAELEKAWDSTGGGYVDRAWRLFVRSWLSFGARGAVADRNPGFNSARVSLMCLPTAQFTSAVDSLHAVADRLRGVSIECRDAVDVMRYCDSPDTLHYLDPPYCAEDIAGYRAGVNHEALLEACKALEGFCVVSGYQSELYGKALAGWHVETKGERAYGQKATMECLWISPRTWKALHRKRPMPLLELCR